MNLYVGNLAPETTREDLLREFKTYGEVWSVSLLTTRMHDGQPVGPSRGTGFVVMPNKAQALSAIAALHLREVRGHSMTVETARPVPPRRHRR